MLKSGWRDWLEIHDPMDTLCLMMTVKSAVRFLAGRADLHANPKTLLHACEEWAYFMVREIAQDNSIVFVDREMIETAMQEAGLRAAKEVAMPCVQHNPDVLNPEDLK